REQAVGGYPRSRRVARRNRLDDALFQRSGLGEPWPVRLLCVRGAHFRIEEVQLVQNRQNCQSVKRRKCGPIRAGGISAWLDSDFDANSSSWRRDLSARGLCTAR